MPGSDSSSASEKREQLRRKLFSQNPESAHIRKMTQVEQAVRRECSRIGIPYEGRMVAIGAIDGHSLSENPSLAMRLGLIDGPVKDKIESRRLEIKEEYLSQGINPNNYLLTGDGYPRLKELWADIYNKHTGFNFDPQKDVYIVHGGMQGIHLGLQRFKREIYETFEDPIPSVVFPAPGFPCFLEQIVETGAKADIIITRPESNFTITSEDINQYKKAGGKGHIFYLTAINNPTSIEISWMKDVLTTIDTLFPQARIVLDGVYLRSAPAERAKAIMQPFEELGFMNRTIFVDSMSKVEGLTGQRIGCIFHKSQKTAGINPVLDTAERLHAVMQNLLAGSASEMQITAQAVFEIVSENDKVELSRLLMERRDRLLKSIFDHYDDLLVPKGKQCGLPHGTRWQGGIYAWIELNKDTSPEEFYFKTGYSAVGARGFYGLNCLGLHQFYGEDSNVSSYVRFSVGMQAF